MFSHTKRIAMALVLICSATWASPSPPAENDHQRAEAIAKRVDAKYNSLQTLQSDFVESYQGVGVVRKESGVLLLKRSGKMRWDFTVPTEKLFISDGKSAYFYVPGERQVRKASVKKLEDFRSPIRYLLGNARLNKEFDDLKLESGSKLSHTGNVILSGIPKHMSDQVQRVYLEITPASTIERITIEELDGSTTEFVFNNLIENLAVPDQRFQFKIPNGVEVIEATELMGE